MQWATRRGWVMMAAALACARGAPPAPGPAAAPDAPAVYRGDLTVRMLLTGELTAEDAVPLVAPAADVWPLQIRWLAEDGAEVTAGERVVEFDNSQLASNLLEMQVRAIEAATQLESLLARTASEEAQAVFELEQSRGNLEKARIEAEAAKLMAPIERERRVLDLRRAELELEEAEHKLDAERRASQAEVEIQRIALDSARTAVARAEAGIDKLSLKAPRDGILIFDENRRERRHLALGRRHRHHEHHAGERPRAHPRDRHPPGGGGAQEGHPFSVHRRVVRPLRPVTPARDVSQRGGSPWRELRPHRSGPATAKRKDRPRR